MIYRYAAYIEDLHEAFLDVAYANVLSTIDDSPDFDHISDNIQEAFFGAGLTISSYPALYDMFGKYMAGLDIEDTWERLTSAKVSVGAIDSLGSSMAEENSENIISEEAKASCTARDVNAVISTAFIIGKACMEDKGLKHLSLLRTNLRLELLRVDKATDAYINWDKALVTNFSIMMKYYYKAIHQSEKWDSNHDVYQKLWPLSVSSDFGKYLGIVSGLRKAYIISQDPRKRSLLSKNLLVLSEAINGAMFGSNWGPYGAAVGAMVGTAYGESRVLQEEGKWYWWAPFVVGPEIGWVFGLF